MRIRRLMEGARSLLHVYDRLVDVGLDVNAAHADLMEVKQCLDVTQSDLLAVNRYLAVQMAKRESVPGDGHFVSYSYPTAYWHGGGVNLGDYIQTIATESAIRKVVSGEVRFETVRRDRLVSHNGGTCVMQGWYEHGELGFMPGHDTRAIWIGTHFCRLVRRRLQCLWGETPASVPFEIGCRDLSTLAFCQSLGIKAYHSRCLTLTLDSRSAGESAKAARVFCVDCPDWVLASLPKDLVGSAVCMNQRGYDPVRGENLRSSAEELLARYRSEARLVITTALHCAQPCLAMGIPVVMINPGYKEEERFSSLKGILSIYSQDELASGKVDFNPSVPDIKPLKEDILENLRLSLKSSLTSDEDKTLEIVRSRIANFSVTE